MRNYMKPKVILIILFLSANLFVFSQTTSPSTIVKVEGGKVEGTNKNGVIIFRGIPFAEPPVGDLRWRAPVPAKRWKGILKAFKFAPACPQQPNIVTAYYTKYGMSEDCLYLNIWKPDTSRKVKLSVLVWIHGGGFNMGSTSQDATTGEILAKKGVIVVSIAYRIGALGFLAHPELSKESENHVSGNYGILDQILALKWIHNNIKSFGGDPECVTIFGLSAGGQSVSILSASPLAKGMFQRAICMSGGDFRPPSLKKDIDCLQLLKGAESDGLQLAKNLGVNSISELRKIDPQKLVSNSMTEIGYWPIIDGYVITDDLYKLYENNRYTDVPVLIGNTSAEGTIFILANKPGEYAETTQRKYGPLADRILSLYPEGTEDITRTSMGDLFRDTYFGFHTFTWATLQTKTGKSPVFVYYFDQPQPASPVTFLQKSDRAYHGSDCFYIFGHFDADSKIKYTAEDRRLSELMMKYWIHFARYGNPNITGLAEWPVYNPENPRVMYLKGNPKAAPLPNLDKLKAIDEYYSWKRNSADKSK
jgi:para-nitrobenzyl esterase